MSSVGGVEGNVLVIVFFVLLAVKIFAFGSSLLFSAESYVAAGKLTKPAWCIILGLGVAIQFVPVGGLTLLLVSTIAAFVYLADVRPALANLTRR
jgi:cell division protein FtsW (lipid II flippase)